MRKKGILSKDGTLMLATFFNIPVKVHWTFGLLLSFITYTAIVDTTNWQQALLFISFVFILFICVVLHEYGHALAAKRFGVKTKDIILSPIGGVARLVNMPSKPAHELVIAFAGPFVNLVIFSVLSTVLWATTGSVLPPNDEMQFNTALDFVRWVNLLNISLFVFNLIPAFPMDGGRVLRALIALKIGRVKATHLASIVGRVLAIGFIIFGVYSQNLILSLIGLFIFMMAGKEYDQTKLTEIVQTTTAREVMRTTFTKLQLHDGYPFVFQQFESGERNFVVFDLLGNPIGTLPELFIKDAITNKTNLNTVNDRYSDNIGTVAPDQKLGVVIEYLKKMGLSIVPIVDGNAILGVIDRQDIELFIRDKVG